MSFAFQTALKNIKSKPLRAFFLMLLVMLLSLTLFTGAYAVASLQKGLSSYQDRLGADIVVIPNSAKGHGSVDDILLQGITGNYYMSGREVEKIRNTEGIETMTAQFFLTSAKAGCCSSRVQIIGFDPETDFLIQPWIEESYSSQISDGDIIAGSSINVTADHTVTFYGQDYRIAAQLAETGTGLDSAVYVNMNTMRQMAQKTKRNEIIEKLRTLAGSYEKWIQTTLCNSPKMADVGFQNNIGNEMIKVADGYSISDVADDINIHITKVEASSAMSMVTGITEGLGGVSRLIGILAAAVWVLALIILVVVLIMISNERKKEFAVFRIMGASRKMLFRIMEAESLLISIAGAVLGLVVSVILMVSLSGSLQNMLQLPFLAPGIVPAVIMTAGAFLVAVCAGLLTSVVSAGRITGSETGLLLRED